MKLAGWARYLGALVVLSGLAACGSHSQALPARVPVAELTGVVTTSGAAHTTASFTSNTGPNGAHSCAAAAQHGNSPALGYFVVSTGSSGTVYVGPRITRYHGPGTYQSSAIHRDDDVGVLINRAYVTFRPTRTSSSVVTIATDASGRASLTNYRADDGRLISATVRWSCRALQ